MAIHPTAIVDRAAQIESDVTIGAYAIVEGPVKIGAGTRVWPHAYLSGDTTLGRDCEVHMHAVIGHVPQDRHFEGAPSRVVLGDRNVIREHATIHRGSQPGSVTEIGNDNLIMAGAHVAHNGRVGNRVILANGVLLAGHATVMDGAMLSGHVLVHQFARVGDLAMVSGAARVSKDVPPYVVAEGSSLVRAMNVVGMRRAGFSSEVRDLITRAYRILYRDSRSQQEAWAQIADLGKDRPEIAKILDFLRSSKRGVCWQKRRSAEAEAPLE
jgi:UDP-N-acetylglucosamine acyltransferase